MAMPNVVPMPIAALLLVERPLLDVMEEGDVIVGELEVVGVDAVEVIDDIVSEDDGS
jgi:hypothetical protein